MIIIDEKDIIDLFLRFFTISETSIPDLLHSCNNRWIMSIMQINQDIITRIAKQVFGPKTALVAISEIIPTSAYGIPRIRGYDGTCPISSNSPGIPKNISSVSAGDIEKTASPGSAGDMRSLLQGRTIPTPFIYAVDSTMNVAPTPCMVMDYLAGDIWTFLTHAGNPLTSLPEKEEIAWQAGLAYAEIHGIERALQDAHHGQARMLFRLEQLYQVVNDGHYGSDLEKLDACRAVIEQATFLSLPSESLCLQDAELHFQQAGGQWQPSFICDMEWVDFGDPYFDLAACCTAEHFWNLPCLFTLPDAGSQPRNLSSKVTKRGGR